MDVTTHYFIYRAIPVVTGPITAVINESYEHVGVDQHAAEAALSEARDRLERVGWSKVYGLTNTYEHEDTTLYARIRLVCSDPAKTYGTHILAEFKRVHALIEQMWSQP